MTAESSTIVGLLHPGDMGAAVGATVVAGGARVLWASAGRSAATRARAREVGLEDAGTLASVVRASRSEEHTSELQSHSDLVCRLLLEKKKQHRRHSGRRVWARAQH